MIKLESVLNVNFYLRALRFIYEEQSLSEKLNILRSERNKTKVLLSSREQKN